MKIAVFGAGAIGCFVGGMLAAGGAEVTLIGRERIAPLVSRGLVLSDYQGGRVETGPLRLATGAEGVSGADLVLVCVKSRDTQTAAALKPYMTPGTTIISLQNGIDNAATLARVLEHSVVPGMVPFNVAWQENGTLHRGTEGTLHSGPVPDAVQAAFTAAGLPLLIHADMAPVLWAKLMLNLNNAINALSGLPLRAQLEQRDYRRCLALAQEEFLSLCREAGQPLARLSPLPAPWIPRVLRLPDALFRTVAGRMLAIDPLARSSMADDLSAGRAPELEALNGAVARLAERLSRTAPVNARLTALVIEAARTGRNLSASALLADLRDAAA
ncbi:2-dehydropantoate 2-reductase [Rhodobacter sp. NTK016B]|uniref:2-dehydropantoate 2-reductase n=1 Tax=Rhodobacter sp. NTK016B TaxID=2759676 RepID=UPI001A8D3EE6|nr:2-dehydropantoate 2-reductase [Rhodobacter sp. NTK016B]MBN8294256.1 2-dehydropantoate 2-reductase [Rhodobacter sp. NTK016B]